MTNLRDVSDMKLYLLSAAAAAGHRPKFPERTTVRWVDWDLEFKVWPSAGAMETALRMVAQKEPHRSNWRRWPGPRSAEAGVKTGG